MERKTKSVLLGAKLKEMDDMNEPIMSLVRSKTPVSVFLTNGVKLSGVVSWAGEQSIVLRHDRDQLIFIINIASICPESGIFFS